MESFSYMLLFSVMVMMVMVSFDDLRSTTEFVAGFIFCFNFQRCVENTMFQQFFPYQFFYLMMISIGYDMHGSIVILSVHTPNVNTQSLLARLLFWYQQQLSSHFSINGADTQKKIGLVIK